MKFNSYHIPGLPGTVRAHQLASREISYMDTEGHLEYSVGLVEFRSTTRPIVGDWIVYRTGETAFRMTDEKFHEMYERRV